MKQILFTAVGIWITIAAAAALTYLPNDASPHDHFGSEPIIRNLKLSAPGERGAGLRLETSGILTGGTPTSGGEMEVAVNRWWVQSLPRDYRRTAQPRHENVSVYLSVHNNAERTLTDLGVGIEFVSRSGHVLHREKAQTRLEIPPGESMEKVLFWYAENNEFIPNDPYDIVIALLASRSLQLRITVREATFRTE